MTALDGMREIREVLIALARDERRELKAAMREGRAIPVVVSGAESIGDPDSDGPVVAFSMDADAAADLRRDAIEEIERILDAVLVRGAT